jgi:transcriptional regulator with XRE-family HTH domain
MKAKGRLEGDGHQMKETKKSRDIAKRMRILEKDYKMSVREIAKVVGVNFYIVSYWRNQKVNITDKNYEKVCNMMLKLVGKNIKYKGQAYDILMEGEEDVD